jgi:hypothetical protein
MNKNVISIFCTVIALIITSAAISFAGSNKSNDKIFYGRIIFVADNYLELKKGKTEITVNITEHSRFILKNGKESDKSSIAVCQYVDAYYSEQAGKKNLDKIIIKKDSDCVK